MHENMTHSNEALFGQIYEDLRLGARKLLAQHQANSMATTALVHEAYLKLAGMPLSATDKVHFFNLASRAMRQVLVDHARRLNYQKRDRRLLVSLDEGIADARHAHMVDLLGLDAALTKLQHTDASLADIVELHFFGGLGFAEMAALLDTSLRTLERNWREARALLYNYMQ